jgi:hypothetical protein
MNQSFPTPPIKPLERVQVRDGLLMNAERWRRAHEYHHERQNIHYQSLNQPGIVCGLGVKLIPPPSEVISQYRDGRWLQIQPGIAIDLVGNPIIVPEPIEFRIASENLTPNPLTVYLVVSYVNPEKLRRKEQREIVQETFRIDEKTSPPSELEVELCRILLEPGTVAALEAPPLQNPADVFFPETNCLDLRYRSQVRSRAQGVVQVALVNPSSLSNETSLSNLSYLLQSVAALYPTLEGNLDVGRVTLQSEEKAQLSNYDLLFLHYQQSQVLKERQWYSLKQYLEAGGVLLVEATTEGTNIKELTAIKHELQKAIANLEISQNNPDDAELSAIRQELEAELESVTTDLDEKNKSFSQLFQDIAQNLGISLASLEPLNRNHPLRIQPFLFSALPTINEQPIQILIGDGIVFVVGNLSFAWGLDEELSLPRETIRTAQEMGINILHFAWRRRQMMQALQLESRSAVRESSTPSKKQKSLKSIYDQLE